MFVQKQHLQQIWINLLKKMERINCLQSIWRGQVSTFISSVREELSLQGGFIRQNTKQEKVKGQQKSEKKDASEGEEDFDEDMLEESDGEDSVIHIL